MKSLVNVVLIAAFALSSTAFAEEAEKKDDANRLICKSEEVTGSRLVKQKRCLTKAQWAEDRRIQKMSIDKAQTARYKNN